jgi:hypothetical protein
MRRAFFRTPFGARPARSATAPTAPDSTELQSALRLSGSDAPAPEGLPDLGPSGGVVSNSFTSLSSARGAFRPSHLAEGTGSKPKISHGPWRGPARSPQSRFKGSRHLDALIGLYNFMRVQLGLCTPGGERAAAGLWIAPATYVSSQKTPCGSFRIEPAFSRECECNRPVANGKRLHRRAGAAISLQK